VVGLTLLTAGAFAVNGTVVVVPPGVITATLFNTGVVLLSIRFRLLLLASGQVESFNGRLGDESLNAHRFMTLMEARHHNDRWPGTVQPGAAARQPGGSEGHKNWPTLPRAKAHRHGVNASHRAAHRERVGNRTVSRSKTKRS
jgi:hypothetical protein